MQEGAMTLLARSQQASKKMRQFNSHCLFNYPNFANFPVCLNGLLVAKTLQSELKLTNLRL